MEETQYDRNVDHLVSRITPDASSSPSRPNSSGVDAALPAMSRKMSYESDHNSTVSGITHHFPTKAVKVEPAPAYVGSAGAAQVVSEHLASRKRPSSDSEDEDDADRHDVHFSEPALALINAFLDHLLHSFLSLARSTSMLALRPAVTEVLKQRLARAAISSADAELAELLSGGEEEEELDEKHQVQEARRKWDLQLVWKRTRLRVMVYIHLGDMEDEDEQRWVERDVLFTDTERRFSTDSGLVSWSAAIFLTSVIEYVAEQALQVAGEAAFARVDRQSRSRRSTSTVGAAEESVMVEEYDVEKIALNASLGRLWRTWRKALRNSAPAQNTSSPSPVWKRRDNMSSAWSNHSNGFDSRPASRARPEDTIPDVFYTEHILAANIPLPMTGGSARDLDEIAAVGLAKDPDDREGEGDGIEQAHGPYPEHVLAPLIPLPMASQQKDLDEIVVPGLARDPEAEQDAESPAGESYPALALAVLVALPMDDAVRDVDEIEVPGLATDPDAPNGKHTSPPRNRRRSFHEYLPSSAAAGPANAGAANSKDPGLTAPTFTVPRTRSMSHPPPTRPSMWTEDDPADSTALETAHADDKLPEDAAAAEATQVQQPEPETMANQTETDVSRDGQAPVATQGKPVGLSSALATGSAVAAVGVLAGVGAAVGAVAGAGTAAGMALASKSTDQTSKPSTEKEVASVLEPSQHASPYQDGAAIDSQKSLVDIKSKTAVNGGSGDASLQVPSGLAASAAPAFKRSTSEGTSYSLGNEEKQAITPSPRASPGPAPRTFLNLLPDDDDAPDHPEAMDGPAQQTPTNHVVPQQPSNKKPTLTPVVTSSLPPSAAVARVAGLKGSEPNSATASEKAVTSASIRGPEDFDSFVQGGETLKYTLTPVHVRDGSMDSSVRYARSSPSPVEMDATPVTPKQAPLSPSTRAGRSSTPRSVAGATDRKSSNETRRSHSRPTPRNTSSHRNSGLLAREARVVTESTRDFADFIRSTAPDKEISARPILPNASTASLHSLRSAHIQGASNSRSTSPAPSRSRNLVNGNDTVPPVPPIPAQQRAKSNMEPRGAKIANNANSDLVDFIRSGPNEDGQRRVSRTMAPSRATLDSVRSDDAARPSAERQMDSSYQTASSIQTASLRTSTNSRSALLNGVNQGSNGYSNGVGQAISTEAKVSAEEANISRKRYRNKDPYAIDYDDDEDEDEDEDDDEALLSYGMPKKPAQRSESMMDFLRNQEPPSSGPVKPLIDPNSPTARRLINDARAKQQGYVADTRTRSMPANGGPRAATAGLSPGSQQAQITSKAVANKPKPEAKSSGSKNRYGSTSLLHTNNLSDFIRNTGPPDDPNSAPAPTVGREFKAPASKNEKTKKKTTLGGIFTRRKNTTYLDMP